MNKAKADMLLSVAYEQYGKAVEKYCRVSLGEAHDSASDCVQEAFIVYYNKLLDGESFENPRAFIYKTANIMVRREKEKHYKSAKYNRPLEEAETLTVSLCHYFSDDTDYDKIKQLLISKLKENEQRLYEMKFVQRKSMQEIALAFEVNPAAAANRVARLRKKILKIIEEGGMLNEYHS